MDEETKKRKGLRAMSKAIGFCAVIWIIGTFVWFVFSSHWDPNIFLIYLVVGIGGIALSGVCEWILRVKISANKERTKFKLELDELDKTVSSLSNWVKNKTDELENNMIKLNETLSDK